MKASAYAHFHPDEHRFVDKALEWMERAGQQHAAKLTDFLDPRQQFILSSLAAKDDSVVVRQFGGYEEAERKRAVIAPAYRDPQPDDFAVQVLAVTSADSKIATLEHGDYMGAILGLGVKRDKIGDIHVHDTGGCHAVVAAEIADFFRLQLTQVHRVAVSADILPPHRLIRSTETLEEMTLSVASMRLDGIASDVFRLSRAKVLLPIKAGKCRVNWKAEEDPSKPLREGDIVSMQGFGRFKVLELICVSKKDRLRVRIGKY